jgi:hypothetical protein
MLSSHGAVFFAASSGTFKFTHCTTKNQENTQAVPYVGSFKEKINTMA